MIEARKKAYNIFPPTVEGHQREKQVNIVKYIDHLGTVTSTNVDQWPVFDVFMNKETELLYTDRSRINELFFKFRGKVPKEATKDEVISEVIVRQIEEACDYLISDAHHRLYQVQGRQRVQIDEAARVIKKYQNEMAKTSAALLGLDHLREGGFKGPKEGLLSVLRRGFFSLHEVQNRGTIRFITRPITLCYFNSAQAVNNVVPMGQYIVEWKIDSNGVFQTLVFRGGNNPLVADYYHPHVARDGMVCYGDGLSAYSSASASFHIWKMAEILESILTTYTNSNPHVHLYRFEEAFKDGKVAVKTDCTFHPDGDYGPPEDDSSPADDLEEVDDAEDDNEESEENSDVNPRVASESIDLSRMYVDNSGQIQGRNYRINLDPDPSNQWRVEGDAAVYGTSPAGAAITTEDLERLREIMSRRRDEGEGGNNG